MKTKEILASLPCFCTEFFIGIETRTTPLTRLGYAQNLRIFFIFLTTEIKEFIGKSLDNFTLDDLAKVTDTHIEIFLNYLSGYYLGEKFFSNEVESKSRKLSAVRNLLKYFYNKDKLPGNVSSKVATPKLREKDIIRLEIDEVVKLLNSAENPTEILTKRQREYSKLTRKRDVAIFTLLLGTGIRVSECVGLNVDDIDFNENAFKVVRKGGHQTVLYFSDEVAKVLGEYVKDRAEIKNIAPEERALFLSLQNKRLCVRAIEQLVKKFSLACFPLKHITPHKLRSTFGTNLYRETGDIYIVADVLGHKDVNTTRKHYAAISENSRRNVARIIKLRED